MTNTIKTLMTILLSSTLIVGVGGGAYAASSTQTDGVLTLEDKEELQDELADAYTAQDVCYSWEFRATGYQGGAESRGSNFGTGTDTRNDSRCENFVHMEMVANYTSPSSESSDDGSIYLYSSFPEITNSDDGKLGVSSGDIVGDNEDQALYTATLNLPRLVADKGLASYLPMEENTTIEVPSTDELKGQAGSDVLREKMFLIVLLVFVALGGVAGTIYFIVKPQRKPDASTQPYHDYRKGRHSS